MTAKEYLQQARGMRVRIEALEERREYYHDLATKRTARYRDDPGGGTRRVGSVEEYACKIVDLEQTMSAQIDEYARLLAEIECVIDAVPDQRYRDLLRYRYLNGWSWNRIAWKMHYQVDSLFRMHTNALRFVLVPAHRSLRN